MFGKFTKGAFKVMLSQKQHVLPAMTQ